jgi:hypothetical protein
MARGGSLLSPLVFDSTKIAADPLQIENFEIHFDF